MKQFMIDKRKALGLTRHEMAQRCDCSERLLEILEIGSVCDITHPNIAARIAVEYGLTLDEYNQIVHESRRAAKLPKPKKTKAQHGLYDAWRSGWGSKDDDYK